MTTTTLFSKQSHFRQQYRLALRTHIGYFVLTFLLIFLFYPLQYLMEIFKQLPENSVQVTFGSELGAEFSRLQLPWAPYDLYGLAHNFTDVSMVMFTMLFLLLPFLLALMLNSYMHSKKAADVYHALPVRRETLMLVNTAVAMTILSVSLVVSNIIIAIASVAKFGTSKFLGYLALDTLSWLACAFLIYVITTCVTTQVGTPFDTFLFSGVCFGILPIIILTCIMMGEMFVYGFTPIRGDFWGELAIYLSPIAYPIYRLSFNFDPVRFGDVQGIAEADALLARNNWVILAYLLVGAGLLWLAMRLYAHRHSERAETTTSDGVLAVVVQGLGTVLGGLYTGFLFYAINNVDNIMIFWIWCAIGGVLAFVLQEVVLNRGFKTLRKHWKLGTGLVALTFCLVATTTTGFFGYENRVPSPDSLNAVTLRWAGGYDELGEFHDGVNHGTATITDEQLMQAVLDYHQAEVDERFGENEELYTSQGKTRVYSGVQLQYDRSGGTMARDYSFVSTETMMKLLPVELSEPFQKANNPFFGVKLNDTMEWVISDAFGWDENRVKLSTEENRRLLEAVQADFLAQTPENTLHPTETIAAQLTLWQNSGAYNDVNVTEAHYLPDRSMVESDGTYSFPLSVPVTDGKTLRVLRELNLLPGTPDLSKCIGVQVSLLCEPECLGTDGDLTFRGRDSVWGSMITRINQGRNNGSEAFASRKDSFEEWRAEMRYDQAYAESVENQTYYPKGGEAVFEDTALIEELSKNMVSSWKADEVLLAVSFYTADANQELQDVLVPMSKLSVAAQEQIRAAFTFPTEK